MRRPGEVRYRSGLLGQSGGVFYTVEGTEQSSSGASPNLGENVEGIVCDKRCTLNRLSRPMDSPTLVA